MKERYVKSVIGPELPPLSGSNLPRKFYPEKGGKAHAGPTAIDCLWTFYEGLGMVPVAQRIDGEALEAVNTEVEEIPA